MTPIKQQSQYCTVLFQVSFPVCHSHWLIDCLVELFAVDEWAHLNAAQEVCPRLLVFSRDHVLLIWAQLHLPTDVMRSASHCLGNQRLVDSDWLQLQSLKCSSVKFCLSPSQKPSCSAYDTYIYVYVLKVWWKNNTYDTKKVRGIKPLGEIYGDFEMLLL